MSRNATPADVIEGRARWCVVERDALDVLASLSDGCVDAVVTMQSEIDGVRSWLADSMEYHNTVIE